MTATIKDIAATLGITHTAVSCALRGLPRVSAKTRQHVLQEAHRVGYRPNVSARHMAQRNGRCGAVALVLPADPQGIVGQVGTWLINGLSDALRQQELRFMVYRLTVDRLLTGDYIPGIVPLKKDRSWCSAQPPRSYKRTLTAILPRLPASGTASAMNSFIHAGLNGSVPVLPEKRFLISKLSARSTVACKRNAASLPTRCAIAVRPVLTEFFFLNSFQHFPALTVYTPGYPEPPKSRPFRPSQALQYASGSKSGAPCGRKM